MYTVFMCTLKYQHRMKCAQKWFEMYGAENWRTNSMHLDGRQRQRKTFPIFIITNYFARQINYVYDG